MSFRPPPFRVEPSPRWVRVWASGTLVADSRESLLLSWYGPGMLPTYCIPPGDVRTDLLRPSAEPAGKLLHTVAHDVVVDGTVLAAGAALLFAAPPPELAEVAGSWTFTWDEGLSWFEEAFEVHVHARDPHTRVDVVPSERHIQVTIDGTLVGESRRPHALFETSLPTRWYLPMEDVRAELLEPTATVTRCPYKGTARYWSVRVGDAVHDDVAWSYPEPVVECPRIAGLVSFFNERVDLTIDGVAQDRPRTPWSR